jgi:hypothetical protein
LETQAAITATEYPQASGPQPRIRMRERRVDHSEEWSATTERSLRQCSELVDVARVDASVEQALIQTEVIHGEARTGSIENFRPRANPARALSKRRALPRKSRRMSMFQSAGTPNAKPCFVSIAAVSDPSTACKRDP